MGLYLVFSKQLEYKFEQFWIFGMYPAYNFETWLELFRFESVYFCKIEFTQAAEFAESFPIA